MGGNRSRKSDRRHGLQMPKWVAIKGARHGWLEPAEVEKLLREAWAAAELHHPNIVSVFEVEPQDDLVRIVCELLEGVVG